MLKFIGGVLAGSAATLGVLVLVDVMTWDQLVSKSGQEQKTGGNMPQSPVKTADNPELSGIVEKVPV